MENNLQELRSKIMSEQGKNSWGARVEKYGLEKAKEMMRKARKKVKNPGRKSSK